MRNHTDDIHRAIAEARRFIQTAEQTLATREDRDRYVAYVGKDNAAMKRSSMDLTRSLAVIRSPL
jgi:hypothetical protein